MVDLKGQYEKIREEVDQAFAEILQSSQFINGPAVQSFIQNLAHYLDAKRVIPCGNGTDALQIALMALDLKPGDEVITTPMTFVATAEVIALLQLKPVFVDANPCTFTIDPFQIEKAITDRTKCILPVHLFGQAANMEMIMEIANRRGLYVIEDTAQAVGADYIYSDGRRQKLGTIGHIGTTSFYPSKNLGCYGDGGAIFTNDEALGQKIHMIANHGSSKRYHHDVIGVNSRLDSFQGAVLDIKLKRLDEYNGTRKTAADYYDLHFKDIAELQIPRRASYSTHVFHQYTLVVKHNREELRNRLSDMGISSAVYYPVPLHLQKGYEVYGYQKGDFPVTEYMADHVLSLPIHSELTPQIQDQIIAEVKTCLDQKTPETLNDLATQTPA